MIDCVLPNNSAVTEQLEKEAMGWYFVHGVVLQSFAVCQHDCIPVEWAVSEVLFAVSVFVLRYFLI